MAIANKPILDVLNGHVPDRTPFWFMRQAGRYLPEYRAVRKRAGSFLNLVYNPELAAEVTLQPVHRLKTDAAILFSDILVIPHALGQNLRFETGEGPRLDAIEDRSGLNRLSLERVEDVLSPIYETVKLVARDMPDPCTLIGFCGGVWTVASYMVAGRGGDDQAAAKAWAYGDPDGFDALISLLEDASIRYLLGQVNAGAQALQIFDSWAGNLPEPAFERLVIKPTKRIVDHVKKAVPHIPIIGFPRGAGPLITRYVEETGVDAVSLDTGMMLSFADDALPPKCAVQGNLDPQMVVVGGPAMEAEARRMLDAFAGRPHIFNLGHGFVPYTPAENVDGLARFLHEFKSDKQH